MKKDNLLDLMKLIKNDEFISKNVKYLFSDDERIDYSELLKLTDEDIEYLLGLEDSRLRFIQLYFSMNDKYYVKDGKQVLKIVSKDLDLEIASILVDLILDGYKGKNNLKLGDIIFRMLSASGVKQAEYASAVVRKCMTGRTKLPTNIDVIINNVSSASEEFQAKYASQFLMCWYINSDRNERIYTCSKIISEAKGVTQAKKACEYAIKHKHDTYGISSLVNSLANANGVMQTKCALRMIEEWNKWDNNRQLKYANYVEYIRNVAFARGEIQALRAMEMYMNDMVLNNREICSSVKFIADAEYGYQAGFASLVAKDNIYENSAFVREMVRIITSAQGPEQAEYASYLAVDGKISLQSYMTMTDVIEMVADADGELQAELAYLAIKKTDLLSKCNGFIVLDAITKLDEKSCILIRQKLGDYIERLPEDVCLQLIEENYSKRDESTFCLGDLMKADDLDLVMDIVSSIEGEEVTEKTKVATKKLIRSMEKIEAKELV